MQTCLWENDTRLNVSVLVGKKICCPGGLSRGGLRITVKANDDGKTNPGEGRAGLEEWLVSFDWVDVVKWEVSNRWLVVG